MTPANSAYNLQVSCELFACWITNKYLKREHFFVIKNDEQVKRKFVHLHLSSDEITSRGLVWNMGMKVEMLENEKQWWFPGQWARHWWLNKVTMLNFQKPRHFHFSILHKTIAKERQNMMVLASWSADQRLPVSCVSHVQPHKCPTQTVSRAFLTDWSQIPFL